MTDIKREHVKLDGEDLADLFAVTPVYEDATHFERRVMGRLTLNLWLRHGFVLLAGLVGIFFAWAQLTRLPSGTFSHPTLAGVNFVRVEVDHSLQASIEFMNKLLPNVLRLFNGPTHVLNPEHMPIFFWLSFSLCLGCIGLYYAYSQEDLS